MSYSSCDFYFHVLSCIVLFCFFSFWLLFEPLYYSILVLLVVDLGLFESRYCVYFLKLFVANFQGWIEVMIKFPLFVPDGSCLCTSSVSGFYNGSLLDIFGVLSHLLIIIVVLNWLGHRSWIEFRLFRGCVFFCSCNIFNVVLKAHVVIFSSTYFCGLTCTYSM